MTLAIMKFWFSGEVDSRAANTFRTIRKELEARLNAELADRDYGSAIEKFAIIPMLLGPEFAEGRPERRLVKRKERVADYRLSIDFDAWQAGSDLDRTLLLVENVLKSIRDIGRKLPGSFRAVELEEDIRRMFPEIANKTMEPTR